MKADIVRLKRENVALVAEARTVNAEAHQALERDLAAQHAQDLHGLSATVETLETDIVRLRSENAALAAEATFAKTDVNRLADQASAARQETQQLSALVETMDADIVRLQRENVALVAEARTVNADAHQALERDLAAQHAQELQGLSATVEMLGADVIRLRSENAALTANAQRAQVGAEQACEREVDVKRAQEELRRSSTIIETLQANVKELMGENAALAAQMQSAHDGVNQASEVERLTAILESLEVNVGELRVENAARAAETEAAKSEAQRAAEREIAAQQSQHARETQQLKDMLATLEADVVRLRGENAVLTAEAQSEKPNADPEAFARAAQNAQIQVDQLSFALETLEADITQLRKQNAALAAEAETAKADAKHAEQTAILSQTSKHQVEQLTAVVQTLETDIRRLRSDNAVLEARSKDAGHLTDAARKAQRQVDQLSGVVQTLEADIRRLRTDNTALVVEAKAAKEEASQAAEMRLAAQRAQSEVEVFGARVQMLEGDVNRLRGENIALVNAQVAKTEAANNSQCQVDQLSSAVRSLEADINRLHDENKMLAEAQAAKAAEIHNLADYGALSDTRVHTLESDVHALRIENERLLENACVAATAAEAARHTETSEKTRVEHLTTTCKELQKENQQLKADNVALVAAVRSEPKVVQVEARPGTGAMYMDKVAVNFGEFDALVRPTAEANASQRQRMMRVIESGDLTARSMQEFKRHDTTRSGALLWNTGEVREFIASVFKIYNLSPPSEAQMYQMYLKFDVDDNAKMDQQECLCLADALFRAVFHRESSPSSSRASSPVIQSSCTARTITGGGSARMPCTIASAVQPRAASMCFGTRSPSPGGLLSPSVHVASAPVHVAFPVPVRARDRSVSATGSIDSQPLRTRSSHLSAPSDYTNSLLPRPVRPVASVTRRPLAADRVSSKG